MRSRRPGDVTFQRWAEGKALVIDVAVTSPLVDTYVRLEDPCNWYAATQKHGKNMTQASRTLSTLSVLWYLRRWEQSTTKVRKCFASYFASQPSALVASLLLIVAEHGLECRAICNGLFRKLF